MISWIELTAPEQLKELQHESFTQPVIIFKHSTRCSISSTVLNRLQRNWKIDEVVAKSYYLDLLNYRSISNEIASLFKVEHQSPQLLAIHQGKVIYQASHFDIDYAQMKEAVEKSNQKIMS